jgi:hypothetical protein
MDTHMILIGCIRFEGLTLQIQEGLAVFDLDLNAWYLAEED